MASSALLEETLARIACRPAAHQHFMKDVLGPIPSENIASLQKLPNEVNLMILDRLDLQSPLADLLYSRHAPTFQYTLAKTDLISTYSALHIFSQTILSDRCTCCFGFGIYVFLLTCQRVCRVCFSAKPEYKFIEITDAEEFLGVSHRQIAAAPFYCCALRPAAFVQAREAWKIVAAANLAPDPCREQMATVFSGLVTSTAAHPPFPSEPGLESGYHCWGCERALVNSARPHQADAIGQLLYEEMTNLAFRLYTKTEIMAHVRQCSELGNLRQRAE
ncbi:hypothetical protein PWT90_06434 [Aphanocladium album]|nr:hypothetical protein PWT90_06434 [Aphanocladium album]